MGSKICHFLRNKLSNLNVSCTFTGLSLWCRIISKVFTSDNNQVLFFEFFCQNCSFSKMLKLTSLEHHREKMRLVAPLFYCIFWCPSSLSLDLKQFQMILQMSVSVPYVFKKIVKLLITITCCICITKKSVGHHFVTKK